MDRGLLCLDRGDAHAAVGLADAVLAEAESRQLPPDTLDVTLEIGGLDTQGDVVERAAGRSRIPAMGR